MLLPPGQGKKREFSTSYIIFEQLLRDLYENRISGYVRLNYWSYEGILILDTGKIIQAYSSEPDAYLTGEKAVFRLLNKAREKDGEVEIFVLDNLVATCLAFSLQAKIYKNEKELEGISLAEILKLIENESLTGYADLQFSEKRGTGTLYFMEGFPVDSVIMSYSGKIASGDAVLERFNQIGKLVQPLCRIYRVVEPSSLQEDRVLIIPWKHEKFLSLWQEVLKYFQTRFSRKLFRKDFSEILSQTLSKIFKEYPEMVEFQKEIILTPESISVKKIISRQQFLDFMSILFKQFYRKLPTRKREDAEKYKLLLNKLAKKYEIDENQFSVDRFIKMVFSGEVES